MTATKDFATVIAPAGAGKARAQGIGFGSVVKKKLGRTIGSLRDNAGQIISPEAETPGRRVEPNINLGDSLTRAVPKGQSATPIEDQGGEDVHRSQEGVVLTSGRTGQADLSPIGRAWAAHERLGERLRAWLNHSMQQAGARNIAIGLAVLGIAGSALATWVAYQASHDGRGMVPVVVADADVTKRRPEHAGGIAVPDRDKLVFERLNATPGEPRVERLLPAAEEPMSLVALAPTQAPQGATESAPAPAEAAAAQPIAEPAPQTKTDPIGAMIESLLTTPAPEPEQVAAAPLPSTAPAIAASAGAWRIQLASLRQRGELSSAWDRLQSRHPVLGALELHIQAAELETGTFYRIQAGPMADRAAAVAACEALTANDQACFVVAP
ncbi:MAG: SPOR domain-containing protein [Alphaproteobacteria bacterium]|nr:SPOR domain-containing protein [Alphaproteobacteria bacterium]